VVTVHRSNEAGKLRLGCLLVVVILVAGLYFGIQFFQVRFRYYQLQDYVKEQATFAPVLDDNTIRTRLAARADTLGIIPLSSPRAWDVRRMRDPSGRLIIIRGHYEDSVVINLPGIRKVFPFRFDPNASEPF
jgi:hypothetical protein